MDPRFRKGGPKSTGFKDLEGHIERYYDAVREKKKDRRDRFLLKVRQYVLTHGCSGEDCVSEVVGSGRADRDGVALALFQEAGHELPTLRAVEDTLRGRLWRVVVGCPKVSAVHYLSLVKKKEVRHTVYTDIRKDTTRTFRSADMYKSRVSEERLVRVLNSYCHKSGKKYVQSMNCVAAVLLTVMPELAAFYLLDHLTTCHFPLYFHSETATGGGKSSLPGAFAGASLACAVMGRVDPTFFEFIASFGVPPFIYFYPIIQSIQTANQNFEEMLKLLDFLFCFGVWLNPVLTVAHVLSNKAAIMASTRDDIKLRWMQQRSWMKSQLNATEVIKETMRIVAILKKKHPEVWSDLRMHCTNIDVALKWNKKTPIR